ncbi:TerB family tellurite resistance protein [Candidatus Kapabacteria bacterium]|nr:TerB family tellurite resistance protein [Candidatus Kapabacteria bacterium]
MSEYVTYDNTAELFICSLIASMYHMALVDGKYDPEERKYISKTIQKYPEYFDSIRKVTNQFEKANLKEEFIVNLLGQCKQQFNEDQRMALVEHSIEVLKADGEIHDKEKMLVKTYLYSLGLNPRIAEKMIAM